MLILLKIFLLILKAKKCETWSIFYEVIRSRKRANFWATPYNLVWSPLTTIGQEKEMGLFFSSTQDTYLVALSRWTAVKDSSNKKMPY